MQQAQTVIVQPSLHGILRQYNLFELICCLNDQLSINSAVTPFRVTKREDSIGSRGSVRFSGGAGAGRRDSIDLIQARCCISLQYLILKTLLVV